uniref:Uncharacterized protein n=1 Tax=Timema genevievae TaxID=629358 RepID=A0A7R9PPR0_TIMGE|nr:unnamed protein product [Timema genevievae]
MQTITQSLTSLGLASCLQHESHRVGGMACVRSEITKATDKLYRSVGEGGELDFRALLSGGAHTCIGRLSTSDWDSNPNIPVIGSSFYCESDAIDHAATEAAFDGTLDGRASDLFISSSVHYKMALYDLPRTVSPGATSSSDLGAGAVTATWPWCELLGESWCLDHENGQVSKPSQ